MKKNIKAIKWRITHLNNLKWFYKKTKTIQEWNLKFKQEHTNLNKQLNEAI